VLLLFAFAMDSTVDLWAAAHRHPQWYAAAQMCSRYFAWHWLMVLAVAGLACAWLSKRRAWIRVLCAMIMAASLAGLSADLLRGMTGRTRPYYREVPQGFYGVRHDSRWLITKHAFNSFPSGHTAAITGFAVPLLWWRRRLLLVIVPLIGAVGAARIYLGSHHLSDVLASVVLGSWVAAWSRRLIDSRKWRLGRGGAEDVVETAASPAAD